MKTKYQNCITPYKYKIEEKYVAWIPLSYNNIFENDIIPKFLAKSISDDKRERWNNYMNTLLAKNSLGYASEEVYFKDNNLTIKDVILNSLKYVFEDELDTDDYEILTDYFNDLITVERAKVIRENNLAIYNEIIEIGSYIQQIRTLLKKYPFRPSEHQGTAHTTKFKSLIKTQINQLEDRLNHPYFPIINHDEIEDTKTILKLLNICLDKEHKNLPEYLNLIDTTYGLESKVLNLNEDDIRIIRIFLNFYNGIKTDRIELVKSVAIHINNNFQKLHLEASKRAESILNIVKIFFLDEINNYDRNNKKRTFAYNAKSTQKNSRVKTILHETFIYAYDSSRGSSILDEMFTIGFNSILGIQNIFEPDKPTEDDISDIQVIRSLINVKNEFGLSTHELRVMLHLFNTYPIILEYSAKRKLSS